MWIDARKSESGYSLVEVMVATVVLTVAILPMVGMFEAGLQAATAGGYYDRARTCAGQKLEQAKSLPYEAVKTWPSEGVCETSGLGYTVGTRFVERDLRNVSEDRGLMKVTITVKWEEGGNSYSVTGVVSEW
ncbi:MAG: prepilin-type N-terminal cleavage/methylation domain-containing protein [Actinomycetota bacterium]|nr:prepilin-type N-terminal cleavage/methylation domain-containing protein [Actinomycetota bacterium]